MSEQLGNNYPNPLDNFRSYSYHFVLTASSTTEAFRKMIAGSGKRFLSKVLEAQLMDEINIDGERAFLVVDTRRFSQYMITSVEMEHVYGTGGRVNPTVPASTMKVKLVDTTGLTFFNSMMDLMRNKLQTTRASAFFLLSIIFVGHKDDGTTEQISTCHIPLTLLLMGFAFNSSGSEYEIEFMELEGAPQRGASMQQIDYLGDVKSISTPTKQENNTVGALIDDFENQLNIQSLATYQKYKNDAMSTGQKGQLGKLVQYMITVPPDWRDFKLTSATRSVNEEQKHLATTPSGKDPEDSKKQVTLAQIEASPRYSQITFSSTTTITDALKIILECAHDFLLLADQKKRISGEAKAMRTVTTITSDDTTYTIHFDIYPYHSPKMNERGEVLSAGGSRNILGSADNVKNLISYDYVFTGRNSHILDLRINYGPESAFALDTNIELGSSRFNYNAAQLSSGKTEDVKKASIGSSAKSTDFNPQIRPGDPIFQPMKSVDQLKNTSTLKTGELGKDQAKEAFKAKQEYTQTYAALHFLSSIVMDMTVRGNPNIIKKFADRDERGGIPPHGTIIDTVTLNSLKAHDQDTAKSDFFSSVKPGVASSKQQYIEKYVAPRIAAYESSAVGTDKLLNNIDVSTLPVFVKVNILAPDVDWTGAYTDANNLFTNKFFFQGPYQLLFVKTTFSNGEFQHTMTLMPYDISGSYSQSNETSPVAPRKEQ